MPAHVRWMVARDMPEVLQIEANSFEFAWDAKDFQRALKTEGVIGMVASVKHHVQGYMVFQLGENNLHLLNMAVAPDHRRLGIGATMVARMVDWLANNKRNHITLELRETNLPAQLFFRRMGFKAVRVERRFYQDTDESAYVFEYCLRGSSCEPESVMAKN